MDTQAIQRRLDLKKIKDKVQSILNQKIIKKWRQNRNKQR